MTAAEFNALPFLLPERLAQAALGCSRRTMRKYVENGVLERVRPAPLTRAAFRKKQIAQILDLTVGLEEFRRENLLLPEKAVTRWTGYAKGTLHKLAAAGTLTPVRLAGRNTARYRKKQIAELIGYPELV